MFQGRGQQQPAQRSPRAAAGPGLLGRLRQVGQQVAQAVGTKGKRVAFLLRESRARGTVGPAPRAVTCRRPPTPFHAMSTPRLHRHVSNLREEESLLTQMVREATAAYEHVLSLVQAVHHMPSEARVHMVLESLLRQQAVGCTIPHTHSDSVLESRLLCQAAAHLKALRELRAQLGAVQSQLHAALDGLYDRTAASAVAARAHSGSATGVAAAAAESEAQPEAPEQLSSPSHQQQWQRSSTTPGSPSSSPQASSSAASSARTVIIRDGDEENDATYDSGFAASAGGGSSDGRYEQYKQCPQHLLAAELVLTSPRQLGRRRREANSSACSRRAAAAAVRSLFGNNHGAPAGVGARVNSGGAGGAAGSDSSVFDLISLSSACPSPPLPSWGCSAATVAAGSIRHQRHAAVLCSKEGRQGPEQQLQPKDQMQESWSFADAASSMTCDLMARDVYHPKSGRHLDLSPSRQSPAAALPATVAATSSNMVRSGLSLHAVSVMLPGGGVLPANYQLTPEAKAWFEDLRKRAEEAEAQQLAMEMASPTGSGGSSSRIDLVATADPFPQQSAVPSAAAAGLFDEFCNQHYQPSEGGDFDFPSPPPPPAYEESWQHPTLIASGAVAGRRGDSATEACCTGDVDTQTGSGPSWTAHTTASGYGTGGMAACWPAAAGATGVMACGAAGHVQLDSDGYGYCWKRLEQEATAAFADEFEGFNDIPLTDRSGAADASDEQQDEEEEEEQEWPPRDQEVLDALIAEGASNAYASEVVQGVPFTYYTKAVFTPRKWN